MDKEEMVKCGQLLIDRNTVGDSGWEVSSSHQVTNRTGTVIWDKKRLVLAEYLLSVRSDDDVVLAVRHHVAHVLSGDRGHGVVWRAYAVRLEAPYMHHCPVIRSNLYVKSCYGAWCCGLWWVMSETFPAQKVCVKCGRELMYADLERLWGSRRFVEADVAGS